MKNKIIGIVAVMMLALPALASAETTSNHLTFWNGQPQYYFDQTGLAASERPFGVECSIVGYTKNKISWTGSVLRDSIQQAYSADGIAYDTRMPSPDLAPLTTFWIGSDVSTTTVPSYLVDVKYAKTGMKTMWYGVTDGNRTELANCGGQFINLDPPRAKQIITLKNGVEIGY